MYEGRLTEYEVRILASPKSCLDAIDTELDGINIKEAANYKRKMDLIGGDGTSCVKVDMHGYGEFNVSGHSESNIYNIPSCVRAVNAGLLISISMMHRENIVITGGDNVEYVFVLPYEKGYYIQSLYNIRRIDVTGIGMFDYIINIMLGSFPMNLVTEHVLVIRNSNISEKNILRLCRLIMFENITVEQADGYDTAESGRLYEKAAERLMPDIGVIRYGTGYYSIHRNKEENSLPDYENFLKDACERIKKEAYIEVAEINTCERDQYVLRAVTDEEYSESKSRRIGYSETWIEGRKDELKMFYNCSEYMKESDVRVVEETNSIACIVGTEAERSVTKKVSAYMDKYIMYVREAGTATIYIYEKNRKRRGGARIILEIGIGLGENKAGDRYSFVRLISAEAIDESDEEAEEAARKSCCGVYIEDTVESVFKSGSKLMKGIERYENIIEFNSFIKKLKESRLNESWE